MNNEPMITENNDYKNEASSKENSTNSTTSEAALKNNRRKYLAAIVGVFLVCAVSVSSYYIGKNSNKTVPTPAKKSVALKSGKKAPVKKPLKVYGINQTTSINDVKYTLTSVKATPAPSNVSVGSGMKCITAQLKIANSGTKSISYDTSAVRAVDLKNKTKGQKPFLNQSELKSGQLDAGKSIEVPLVFVVPKDSSQFRIIYRDTANKTTLIFKADLS